MTPERLAEIREREQAATPGPWTSHPRYPHVCWQGDDPGEQILSANLSERPAEDIAFVAHARDDIPRLLAEVDRLKVEHERQVLKLIDERDRLADLLDTFAAKVAPVEVIGEHSSGNDLWRNALDLVTPAAEVEQLKTDLAEMESAASEWAARLALLRTRAETRLRELATNGDAYRKVGNKAGAARQDYAAAEIRSLLGIEWKPGGGA